MGSNVQELMNAVAEGDDGAFEALYDRLAPAVLGVVRAVVKDLARPEDIVQEVFVEVWRTATRRPDGYGATAWVLSLAHRRAVDRVRAAREHVETDACERAYGDLVAALPEQERRSIVLAYYDARTCREVAAALAVDADEALSLLRSGLRRLSEPESAKGNGHVGAATVDAG